MSLFMFRGTGSAFAVPTSVEVPEDGFKVSDLSTTGVLDLSAALNAITGFEPTQNQINVPVLKYRQEVQIAGPETFATPQLVVVEEDGVETTGDAAIRQQVLDTLVAGYPFTLVIFRHTQDPAESDPYYWTRASVASQVPNFSLDATAATTAINLSLSTPLLKATVQAG